MTCPLERPAKGKDLDFTFRKVVDAFCQLTVSCGRLMIYVHCSWFQSLQNARLV